MPFSQTKANGSCAFLATLQAILQLPSVNKTLQCPMERVMRWLAANGLQANAHEYTPFIAVDEDCEDVAAAQTKAHDAFVESIRRGAYGENAVLVELAKAFAHNIRVVRYKRHNSKKVGRKPATVFPVIPCGVEDAPTIHLRLVSYDEEDDQDNDAAHYSAFIHRKTTATSHTALTAAIQQLVRHLHVHGKSVTARAIQMVLLSRMTPPTLTVVGSGGGRRDAVNVPSVPALPRPQASPQTLLLHERRCRPLAAAVSLRRSSRLATKRRRLV